MISGQVIIAKLKDESIGFESWSTLNDGSVPRVYTVNKHPKYGNCPYINTNTMYFSMIEKTSGIYQLDVEIALEHGIIDRKKLALGSIN